MKMHEVYKCVPDMGQTCISTRWVITEKSKDNKKIMRASLVASTYEDLPNLKKDSTCNCDAVCFEVVGRDS